MPENAQPEVIEQLNEVLGHIFARHLSGDQAWAQGVLSGVDQS